MAEVQITFDDGTGRTHEVPEDGAREIDGTLMLWEQYSGGIILEMEDGGEEVIMPPIGLREYVEDDEEPTSQSGLHTI